MDLRQGTSTCHWLLENQLADAVDSSGRTVDPLGRFREHQQARSAKRRAANSNPLFIKWSLGDPSGWLERLTPHPNWTMRRVILAVWFSVLVFAGWRLFENSHALASALHGVLDPAMGIWLVATLVGLKLLHELGHALTCHALGGRVRDCGFVFILFTPIPYVDVTSCWGFESKQRRMIVSAAGMMVEIGVAACAAIAWSITTDVAVRFHLFNIILAGSVTTLLFNANFLMRFDGYYLLADTIEIPNLYAAGRQATGYLANRFLLGRSVRWPAEVNDRPLVVTLYGIAAFVWRVLVCVSLTILASTLFAGFGQALAALSVATWLSSPLRRFWKVARTDSFERSGMAHHGLTRIAPIICVLFGLAMVTPWPFPDEAPALVEHADSATARLVVPGFLSQIQVREGEEVLAGDVLVTLTNPELHAIAARLEAQVASTEIRCRQHHHRGDIASYQAESEALGALQARLRDAQQKRTDLILRAPSSGCVVAPRLDEQLGRYLPEGTEVAKIVHEESKQIFVSIAQDDLNRFEESLQQQVHFETLASLDAMPVVLCKIEPRASLETDVRLTSVAGGPLVVQPGTPSSQAGAESMVLTSPRFVGRAELNEAQSNALVAGTRGSVQLAQRRDSVANVISKGITQWLEQLIENASRR